MASVYTVDVCLAASGSVERHIADDDVFARVDDALLRRADHQLAAGKALAEITGR